MNRKEFIESEGATCRNWRWSWSFVDHKTERVIFGAWDVAAQGGSKVILDDNWERLGSSGRKQPGYSEAIEYINLVRKGSYSLWTFPIGHALIDPMQPNGTAKITSVDPVLSQGFLGRQENRWLSLSNEVFESLPDEVNPDEEQRFVEGERRKVWVDSVERNPRARAKCLELFGYSCKVCSFDFLETYGDVGLDFIHVHHINPIGKIVGLSDVDPSKDLVPVCPNCHAMIHRKDPPYTIEEVSHLMQQALAGK